MIEWILVSILVLTNVLTAIFARRTLKYFFVVDIDGTEHIFEYDGNFPDHIRAGYQLEIMGIRAEVVGIQTKLERRKISIEVYCSALIKKEEDKHLKGDDDGNSEED